MEKGLRRLPVTQQLVTGNVSFSFIKLKQSSSTNTDGDQCIRRMIIDTNYKVYSDANGGDPDCSSPTLRRYHKLLWSKPLPNGKMFELSSGKPGVYLYHKSDLGEFSLGSDAIIHSYDNHKRKRWLTEQIKGEVDELSEVSNRVVEFHSLYPLSCDGF